MPAGGGTSAANHISNVAAKDGTAIGAIQNTVPFEPFFGNRQAQFDATKLNVCLCAKVLPMPECVAVHVVA